jgi:hypothetical protein
MADRLRSSIDRCGVPADKYRPRTKEAGTPCTKISVIGGVADVTILPGSTGALRDFIANPFFSFSTASAFSQRAAFHRSCPLLEVKLPRG